MNGMTRKLVIEVTDNRIKIDGEGEFVVGELIEIARAIQDYAMKQRILFKGVDGNDSDNK